jgi:hypothetical protein
VELKEAAIASQWPGKHTPTAVDMHITVEESWEGVFSMQSVMRLCNKNRRQVRWQLTVSYLLVVSYTYSHWLPMNMEAVESPLLAAISKQQLVKTKQIFFCNHILFAICIITVGKFCKNVCNGM